MDTLESDGRRPARGAHIGIGITLAALLSGCILETKPQAPAIMFMGNSITRNPPAPAYAWSNDWGMAATSRDKDYVHRTISMLHARGLDLDMHIAGHPCPDCDGGIDEQAHNMDEVRALHPRYVVVQLSEHSGDIELLSGKMTAQYRALLQGLVDNGVPHIYCFGAWGEAQPDGLHAQAIWLAMKDFRPAAEFLDIHAVAADPTNSADTSLFKNPDVRWHPGDKGMEGMAKILSDAIMADR